MQSLRVLTLTRPCGIALQQTRLQSRTFATSLALREQRSATESVADSVKEGAAKAKDALNEGAAKAQEAVSGGADKATGQSSGAASSEGSTGKKSKLSTVAAVAEGAKSYGRPEGSVKKAYNDAVRTSREKDDTLVDQAKKVIKTVKNVAGLASGSNSK